MIRFFIKLIILTIILSIIIIGVQQISIINLIDQYIWEMVILLFSITSISHTISYIGTLRKPEESLLFSFASIGIHFLLSIVSITILIFNGIENTNTFFFNFLVLYFCYTLFDIYSLITNLRPNSKKSF